MMIKRYISIFMLLFVTLSVAQDTSLFNQGKENYKAEQYDKAIENWIKILDNGNHSAALYFNLGNAYYKLNEIGPSVYFYEKAKQLAPNDSDIATNLAFAENAKIDAIAPLPKTVFSKWYDSISGVFSFEGWAKGAVVFMFLFVALFLGYYYAIRERKKRTFFVASWASFSFFVVFLILAFLTFGDVKKDKPAIVFAKSVEIKAEPKLNSNTAFILHEGTKVQILVLDGDWARIKILNGKDGWIPLTDIKKL